MTKLSDLILFVVFPVVAALAVSLNYHPTNAVSCRNVQINSNLIADCLSKDGTFTAKNGSFTCTLPSSTIVY